mgnify:CR=1 FL=1
MDLIKEVERQYLKEDIPDFGPGDTVRVHVKIVEGARERTQVFEGVVLRRQGQGLRETFTVRRVTYGVGVERIFPVHAPSISRIEVVKRGRVHRAKLYYLRQRTGRAARIRDALNHKRMAIVHEPFKRDLGMDSLHCHRGRSGPADPVLSFRGIYS